MNFKQLDQRIVTIFLIVFVQILGASMVLPILPLYAQNRFELSPQAITLLVSSFFAAQFVAGPFLGRLSDRYGRIPVLLVSQIGTAISFLMLGIADSVWLLYAARIFDGITGGNIIVAQAYVTDITPREKRAESLGIIFAAFGLGFIFGPALGGVLSAAFGAQVPFILAAVAALALVFITHRTLDETLTPEERAKRQQNQRPGVKLSAVFSSRNLLMILLMGFVGQFALGMLQATFALYGEAVLFVQFTPAATAIGIGLLLSVVGVTQAVTQLVLLRRLLARYSQTLLIMAGLIIRGLGLVIFAAVTSPYLGAFGSVFFALGTGIMIPPLQALATENADDSLRGGVLGIFQSVTSLSTIISTGVAGIIFAISPTMPYWIGAGMTLLILPLAYHLWQQEHGQQAANLPVETSVSSPSRA